MKHEVMVSNHSLKGSWWVQAGSAEWGLFYGESAGSPVWLHLWTCGDDELFFPMVTHFLSPQHTFQSPTSICTQNTCLLLRRWRWILAGRGGCFFVGIQKRLLGMCHQPTGREQPRERLVFKLGWLRETTFLWTEKEADHSSGHCLISD